MKTKQFNSFESKFQSQLHLRRNEINQVKQVFEAVKSTVNTKSEYMFVKNVILDLKLRLKDLNKVQQAESNQFKQIVRARRNSQENQQKVLNRQKRSLERRAIWLQKTKQPVAV